jgi:hypothetical protein
MHIDLRMGCDPNTAAPADCFGRSLNNGYEQLFIAAAPGSPPSRNLRPLLCLDWA